MYDLVIFSQCSHYVWLYEYQWVVCVIFCIHVSVSMCGKVECQFSFGAIKIEGVNEIF